MSPEACLEAALEVIKYPSSYVADSISLSWEGDLVPPYDPKASRFNLYGALHRTGAPEPTRREVKHLLCEALQTRYGSTRALLDRCEELSHEEALGALREALRGISGHQHREFQKHNFNQSPAHTWATPAEWTIEKEVLLA